MNGVTEALVKSVKRSLNSAIGDQVLSFSELQTAMFEATQFVNSRPIGKHPSDPCDGAYLCPNDLLLGRSSNLVPQGPFRDTCHTRRFYFIQQLVESFWRKWTRDYFPGLITQEKWHVARRDVKVDDIVLVKDTNSIRGEWKLAKVCEAMKSQDNRVRKVKVMYKNISETERPESYAGSEYTVIERPVHNLVVIVAGNEDAVGNNRYKMEMQKILHIRDIGTTQGQDTSTDFQDSSPSTTVNTVNADEESVAEVAMDEDVVVDISIIADEYVAVLELGNTLNGCLFAGAETTVNDGEADREPGAQVASGVLELDGASDVSLPDNTEKSIADRKADLDPGAQVASGGYVATARSINSEECMATVELDGDLHSTLPGIAVKSAATIEADREPGDVTNVKAIITDQCMVALQPDGIADVARSTNPLLTMEKQTVL